MKDWRLVINPSICNGCYACQVACKDENVDNDWMPYAQPQPDIGQFWMKVNQNTRGTVPKVKMSYVAMPCQHCQDAPCMAAATGGAIYRRPDGIVIIDPAKAVGQTQLVAACPYGAIYWNDDLNIPQKCTACAHILDGRGNIPSEYPITVPRCVDSCPTSAIKFGEESDLQDLIGRAEVLHPEYGAKPRVYYLNLPKKFIAGDVFDPVADECLEGATVTAIDLASGKDYSTQTDEFGDFWLKNVETDHNYSVEIRRAGYAAKKIGNVQTSKDVNLGSIELKATGA
jgi:tetrathionate reductase subunit B